MEETFLNSTNPNYNNTSFAMAVQKVGNDNQKQEQIDHYRSTQQYFDEINKKNKKGSKYLIDKYTPQKILNTLEKIQLLEIEREIKERTIILAEFVQIFLKHMNYQKQDKAYVTVGLIDLFNEVREYEQKFIPSYSNQAQPSGEPLIRWTALTGYFIDNVIQGGNQKTLVPNKYISKNTADNFKQVYASKQLDQFSAEIIGGSSLCLRRFKQSQKLIDSYHHNQGIRNVQYVKELHTILVLDNLTDEIHFYNEHSNRIKSIKPKSENHIIDTGILFFTYSFLERRIGACLQDYSLAFWDQSDNFSFEKTFNAHLEVLQIFIKYVEYCTTWITVDQKNSIYVWDIEKESAIQLPKRHEERITDICEITHLRLLAACSLDKKIIFWDLQQRLPAQILKLDGVSSHSMCYCQDFRVLATAQYENSISIWSFEGKDCSLLSRLVGHNAQVTSIQILKDTPLLISADEIGFLKTWDIRSSQCVQTVHFECKSSIHQFININDKKFIGIEYRLHWFEFEDKAIVNANGIEFLNMAPISIRYNSLFNQLCIATKSDIRIVNIRNGQTELIIANLVKDEDGEQSSDLTQFTLTKDCKKFIVGDNKGNIRTYLYQTSQLETINCGHSQEITSVKLDDRNNLILSAGWDSQIILQKSIGQKNAVTKAKSDLSPATDDQDDSLNNDDEEENEKDSEEVAKSQILRQIKNAHFGQEISAIALSLRLSMIATASHGIICLWDYETMRLIGGMTNNFSDILVLEFLDPFPLLCTLDVSGQIIIWEQLQQFSFSFKIYQALITIHFSYSDGGPFDVNGNPLPGPYASKLVKQMLYEQDFEYLYTTENDRKHPEFQNFKDCLDICESYEKKKKFMVLILSDDTTGNVFVIEIQSILDKHRIDKKSINALKRREYNPFRNIQLNSNGIFNTEKEIIDEFNKIEQRRLEEIRQQKEQSIGHQLKRALSKRFFESQTTFGSLGKILQKQQSFSSSPKKLEDTKYYIEDLNHFKFKAANEAIIVLQVIDIPPKIIITSTNSQIVRIWSIFGDSLCILDIDKPLPNKWKLKISSYFKRKLKFTEAITILKQIEQSNGDVSPKKKDRSMLAANAFGEIFEKTERFKNLDSKNQSATSLMSKKFRTNDNYDSEMTGNPMMLSHQKFFQSESESITFQKFLNKIDNIAQFSLLDKIESIINIPKKHNPKTKEWENALEEDIKTIQKARVLLQKQHDDNIREVTYQVSLDAAALGTLMAQRPAALEASRRSSTLRLPKTHTLVKNQQKSKQNLLEFSDKKEPTININTVDSTIPHPETYLKVQDQSKFDPPDDHHPTHVNDKSISSYQSTHVITLFNNDKKKQSMGLPNALDKSSFTSQIPPILDISNSKSVIGGKTKKDWLTYASKKIESLPNPNLGKDQNFPIDKSSSQLSTLIPQLKIQIQNPNPNSQKGQYEAQKLRTKIFRELDSKRKFYKRNFATVKDYQYLENLELNDDVETYDPPQFLKDLNSSKQQFGKTPRIKETFLKRINQGIENIEGQISQRGMVRNASSILPNIKSRL
ncbi:rna recognition motif [Stylonychia lemnae]|uniref:Rna recognition motif n=1 Tax=Stylonychia lemnae TaxID=5949 RepID=A0A077ZYW2_STYLE|nr:rna recognition motif [Stylonychia lemnae]|eukprot:CDW75100.1 rna recognition motif [Stylonychia lemnae]